eukprot:5383020-Heterocapsa_arctica.AAC.1
MALPAARGLPAAAREDAAANPRVGEQAGPQPSESVKLTFAKLEDKYRLVPRIATYFPLTSAWRRQGGPRC